MQQPDLEARGVGKRYPGHVAVDDLSFAVARGSFFSILGPHQHLRAHWGYYKGFLRYHLALVVPGLLLASALAVPLLPAAPGKTTIAAALEIGARPQMAGKRLVVIVASSAERYLSTELLAEI